MESLPLNWILVEEWESNFIFENSNRSFSVNVTFTEQFDIPYDISFSQLKGDFTIIGYEDGAYSTYSNTKTDALQKSFEMMAFIDSK